MIKNFPIQFQIIQNGTHNSPFQFGFSKTILSEHAAPFPWKRITVSRAISRCALFANELYRLTDRSVVNER